MAEVKKYIRTLKNNGDVVLSNILDSYTGEAVEFIKIDPTGITPEGVIYRQLNTVEHGLEIFKRIIINNSINVTAFGIKGDGNTDDTVKFQAAIDICSLLGIDLIIPEGITLKISNTITISNHIRIIFSKNSLVTSGYLLTTMIPLFLIRASNVSIDGLILEGNDTYIRGILTSPISDPLTNINISNSKIRNIRGAGIYLFTASFSSVRNCSFSRIMYTETLHGSGDGDLGAVRLFTGTNIEVSNCDFDLIWGKAMATQNFDTAKFTNCRVNRIESDAGCGFYCSDSSKNIIFDGIVVTDPWAQAAKISRGSDNIRIMNCELYSQVRSTIGSSTLFMQGVTNTLIDNTIITSFGNKSCIQYESHPEPQGSDTYNNKVTNCTIEAKGSNGITFAGGFIPGEHTSYQLFINNNTIKATGRTISCASPTQVKITDNILTSTTTVPVYMLNTNIEDVGERSDNLISGNTINCYFGNAIYMISNDVTVRDNVINTYANTIDAIRVGAPSNNISIISNTITGLFNKGITTIVSANVKNISVQDNFINCTGTAANGVYFESNSGYIQRNRCINCTVPIYAPNRSVDLYVGDNDLNNNFYQVGAARINRPYGASRASGSGSVTGAIVIKLPKKIEVTTDAKILKMRINVVNGLTSSGFAAKTYDVDFTGRVDGIDLGSPTWGACNAVLTDLSATPTIPTIRAGFDVDKYPYIIIGDVADAWVSPTVTVENLVMSFRANQWAEYESGWSINFSTDISAITINKTVGVFNPRYILQGTNANRPVSLGATDIGVTYFDTTLNSESIWNGTVWIDKNVIDTTSTVYTKATLNTMYPNAKRGLIVIQDAISKIYIKKDSSVVGNWTTITTGGQLA